jgi:hypothetical protein
MELVCAAVRVQLLAQRAPRKLIIQLFSLVYRHGSAAGVGADEMRDPPDRVLLVHHVVSSQKCIIPRLQAEFQPVASRVGQVRA